MAESKPVKDSEKELSVSEETRMDDQKATGGSEPAKLDDDDDDEGANGAKALAESASPVDMKTNYEGLYSDQHNIG